MLGWILGGLGFLKKLGLLLIDFATRKPALAACIILALLTAWLWHGKNAEYDRAEAALNALEQLQADYAFAQAEAKLKQEAADREFIALQTIYAEKFDAQDNRIAVQTRDAVSAYAATHPVRRCLQGPSAGGALGGAGDGALPGDPGQPTPDDTAPDMVAITREDLDALSQGAVQNARKTDFLNGLVEQGWAIPLSKVLPRPDMPVDRQP